MENFVTLFNNSFLPQGITLHRSMVREIKDFKLWIVCVDVEVYNNLQRLSLSNTELINLNDFETSSLLGVKNHRSLAEYCWTLTPFTPKFVFDSDAEISRVTYIDADLWFRKDPVAIFNEFTASGKDVMITDHAYSPEYDQSHESGQFCVQFMIFNRSKNSEIIRKDWELKCIDWCFNRHEDGKFGDQKYLDDWPKLFPDHIHILSNKELILAPWNLMRFPYGNSVVVHFHGLRILNSNSVYIGNYKTPRVVLDYIYKVYLKDLSRSLSEINNLGCKGPKSQMKYRTSFIFLLVGVKNLLRSFLQLKANYFSKIQKINI